MVRQAFHWLRSALGRPRFERDLDDEMTHHLSMRADDLVREGMTRSRADRQARIEFGAVDAHKEDVRASRGLAVIDGIVSDIRYVLRSLDRHRLLSASIVATLALTIGLSTGVFALIDAVALRARVDHDRGSFFRVHVAHGADTGPRPQFGPSSMADFTAFRAAATSARQMTAYVRLSAPLDASDQRDTRILAVTCNFFSTYVPPRPLLGRALQQSDCDRREPVVVLAESAWRDRYVADSAIVGRTIRLNDRAVTVIGVLPTYDGQLESAQAWIPYTTTPMLGLSMDFTQDPDIVGLTVDGFAAPGHSRADVAAELAVAAAQQDRLYPHRRSEVLVTDGSSIEEPGSRARITAVVTIVMLVLGFVVFIACTNVTMLLLARAESRRHEVGIRLAMGASRLRLLRLLLTETLLLALVSGAISIWFAYSIPRLLARVIGAPEAQWSFAPDWRVFAWVGVITLLAGATSGLSPALQALDVGLMEVLKAGGAGSGSGHRRPRVYNRLVASQLALSFILVTGSCLFYRAYQRMSAVEIGHATRDVMSVSVTDRDRANRRVGPALRSTLRPRMIAVPDVRRVAFASALPSAPRSTADEIGISVGTVRTTAAPIAVSADFFETLRIPILHGHALGDAEPMCASGGCPVVLSQALARRLFGSADPVGSALRTDSGVVMQVVGVAGDVTTATGMRGPLPLLYEPWNPDVGRYTGFLQFAGHQSDVAGLVGATIRQGVPDVAVDVRVVQATIDEDVQLIHQIALLIGVLGVIAACLAMIGVHGIVAFAVRRRTKELGVRIALGATSGDIYRVVARGHARPIATGLVAGLLASIPAALFVQRLLGGPDRLPILDRASPLAFGVAAMAMLVAIALAVAAPARRAAVADPLQALRSD